MYDGDCIASICVYRQSNRNIKFIRNADIHVAKPNETFCKFGKEIISKNVLTRSNKIFRFQIQFNNVYNQSDCSTHLSIYVELFRRSRCQHCVCRALSTFVVHVWVPYLMTNYICNVPGDLAEEAYVHMLVFAYTIDNWHVFCDTLPKTTANKIHSGKNIYFLMGTTRSLSFKTPNYMFIIIHHGVMPLVMSSCVLMHSVQKSS